MVFGGFTEKVEKSGEYSYPVKYTWRIPDFSKINTKYLFSDIFVGGDHKWKIKMYPKGSGEDDAFSLYLCLVDKEMRPSELTRRVKLGLSVVSEIDEHTFRREFEKDLEIFDQRGWGYENFINHDELRQLHRRFLVDDTITIRAEVRFNEEQEKEQPNIKIESSSLFSKFETLFTDLQNHDLQEKLTYSDEEITDAQMIFKQCLGMNVTSFIRSGKAPELKKALSLLLTTKVIVDSKVDETTKFVANFDQLCEKYEAAKRDLNEARVDEDTVGELKTVLKQLFSQFVSLRNQIEAADSEISREEKLLAGSKADRVRLRKKLTELTQQATTSKQALLSAEKAMKVSAMKKEEADKTVSEFHISWESLKEILSLVN